MERRTFIEGTSTWSFFAFMGIAGAGWSSISGALVNLSRFWSSFRFQQELVNNFIQ